MTSHRVLDAHDGTTMTPAIEPAGFFVLRAPLLPFSTLTDWAEGLRAPMAAAGELEAVLSEDRRLLRLRLAAIVSRPAVREALFVASPSLDESLSVWMADPECERGQKVERTLVRYLARMAGRATPFGLFAGCSAGRLGEVTRLLLGDDADTVRHTRLDGDYLCGLTDALGRELAVRRAARYRPNSSLYRAAGRIRYIEARLDQSSRSYHLVSVEPTEYLEATLARAAGGARLEDLAGALVEVDVTREDADDFVGQLIDAQLLVSDLQPQVTGPEPIHELVDQLAQEPATRSIAEKLGAVRDALAHIDDSPLGTSPSAYREIAAGLRTLPAKVELSRLFQVDMIRPLLEAELGREVLEEVRRGVEYMWRLSAGAREDGLTRFRDAFVDRYGAREVPLAEVLDEEAGLGFEKPTGPSAEACPLLQGLIFAGRDAEDGDERVEWNPGTALLFRKLQDALRTGAHEIVLAEADVEGVARENPRPLPDSLAAMVTLTARSEEDLAAGAFVVWMQSIAGPSGANVLGRFCHGDPQLAQLVKRYLHAEEMRRPEAVFAEVVHLPEGRIGNVLLRPLLREYEIPYLGRSGAPLDTQIGLEDLLVAVVDQRVVLRSRRLGREVIPRLTSAHNFSHPFNLGVYRFLCALQQQGVAGGLMFSWGALSRARFLPRVRVGRLVLSPARWRLEGEELGRIGTARGASLYAEVRALRRARSLPRWVGVADSDNVLPVDLDNPLSIETCAQLIKSRSSVTLTEMADPEHSCARGLQGSFVHEIVLPLMVEGSGPRATPRGRSPSTTPRSFPPGSEWLYVKLYTGPATADLVLRDLLAPAVRVSLASGAADSWFFIRYGDPDWHLRARFHGQPARLHGEVLPLLQAAVHRGVGASLVWKVQLETYEREMERYGGDAGVALAEELFCADSDACLAIVQMLSGDEGADARWRLALRGMDMLLDDLGFDLDGKRAVMHECRRAFRREFHAEGSLAKQLGDRFRKERLALESLLEQSRTADPMVERGLAVLEQRSRRVQRTGAALRERANLLHQPLASLAQSFLHMHANRLLHAAARAQELVLYDFLDRLYEGRSARAGR
jgi:thiopeptide-type bacteriocin biosynthesis protein